MLSDLLLLSGNDIPFAGARAIIHQPTLKEIAYIGEEMFFVGCGFLNFSKDLLSSQDKIKLADYDDFNIFMMIITNRTPETKRSVEAALLVLTLIFPLYKVGVRTNEIVLSKDGQEFLINKANFQEFKEILIDMFSLNLGKVAETNYNPEGTMAQRIADKFKKRHEQLLKIKSEAAPADKRVSILSRYASILAVGNGKDLNELMDYTVCQLYDEFQRFQLKVQWDAYIQARMAGAKDLEEVDNWMIDLREQGKNNKK